MAIYALGDQRPTIDPTAFVHPDAVIIGSVTIGAQSTIWPGAVLRGDDGEILVGARTSIQDGTVLHTTPSHPTTVGDDCVIGHVVHLEACVIHDGALVGSGSVVLHRVVVESGAIVGANALVPNNMRVPTGFMALGVPAKLREASPDAIAMIGYSKQSYVDRGVRYAQQLHRLD